MHRLVLRSYTSAILFCCTSVIMAAPNSDDLRYRASSATRGRHLSVAPPGQEPDPVTEAGQVAGSTLAPAPSLRDPSGLNKNRFISFSNPEVGLTAVRVVLVSLHHVDPPYTGGPSVPFTLFEGQAQYVGPPTRYVESLASGMPFHASVLQCAPYYLDWSTVGLLHVTGEAIVPSSIYDVQTLAASCLGDEAQCADVSEFLTIATSRWGDVVGSSGPPGSAGQTDISDISALVDKFKDVPGAPMKSLAMLEGDSERGLIDPRPAVSFSQVAAGVDAFKGQPYPRKPGKCSTNSALSCISDEECSEDTPGLCVLCGNVSGGACCHADGTCDVLPASDCTGPNDMFKGEGAPCSRCCGPTPGCEPLNNIEWFDAQQLWPNLDRRDVCKEAEEDSHFNCVSWTLDNTTDWIWDEVNLDGDALWESSEFEDFFAQYQKSAIIYGGNNNAVLHTARPLPNNCASSKLGEWIRMRHDRNQIEGGYFGDILGSYAY